MTTPSELRKAMRGTKRACQACGIRFYDLSRTPIVCPSCGEQYVPAAEPTVEARQPATAFHARPWRSKGAERVGSTPRPADPEDAAPSLESAPAEDPVDVNAAPILEDEALVEHEADDSDVSEFVEQEVEDGEDR